METLANIQDSYKLYCQEEIDKASERAKNITIYAPDNQAKILLKEILRPDSYKKIQKSTCCGWTCTGEDIWFGAYVIFPFPAAAKTDEYSAYARSVMYYTDPDGNRASVRCRVTPNKEGIPAFLLGHCEFEWANDYQSRKHEGLILMKDPIEMIKREVNPARLPNIRLDGSPALGKTTILNLLKGMFPEYDVYEEKTVMDMKQGIDANIKKNYHVGQEIITNALLREENENRKDAKEPWIKERSPWSADVFSRAMGITPFYSPRKYFIDDALVVILDYIKVSDPTYCTSYQVASAEEIIRKRLADRDVSHATELDVYKNLNWDTLPNGTHGTVTMYQLQIRDAKATTYLLLKYIMNYLNHSSNNMDGPWFENSSLYITPKRGRFGFVDPMINVIGSSS